MPALRQVEGLPAGLLKVRFEHPLHCMRTHPRHMGCWAASGSGTERECEAYAHHQDYGTMILGITVKYHEQRSGSKQ